MFDARAFNGCGKLQGFFKSAVGNFHLLIRHSDGGAHFIASRPGNVKLIALNINFEFLSRDTGKFDFNQPAVRAFDKHPPTDTKVWTKALYLSLKPKNESND